MLALQANDFWQFSLTFYADKSNEALCLWLQDNAGCNVNLLLLCVWTQQMQLTLAQDALTELQLAIAGSEQDLSVHREKRRALLKGSD